MSEKSDPEHLQTPEKSSRPSSEVAEGFEPKEDATGETIANDDADPEEYSHGLRLAALVISLLLGMFLVALDNVRPQSSSQARIIKLSRADQTILGTAIPKITDEFHDLNKVAWYGSVCRGCGELCTLKETLLITTFLCSGVLHDFWRW